MLLAAADTSAPTDWVTWVNFGALGAVLISAFFGFVWFKPSIDALIEERNRALAERDKAVEQRDAMAQVLQDRLLPVVGDFITTTRALLPILQDVAHSLRQGSDDGSRQEAPRPARDRPRRRNTSDG